MQRLPPPSVCSLLSLLSTPTDSRPPSSLNQILHILLTFPQFRDLPELSIRLSCCQRLYLSTLSRGFPVFSYGEEAARFFVLLQGKAATEVPTWRYQRTMKSGKVGETLSHAVKGLVDRQRSSEGAHSSVGKNDTHKGIFHVDESLSPSDMTVISTLMPGDSFGECSLSDSTTTYHSTVECIEDCTFIVLEAKVYKDLLKDYHERKSKEYVKLIRDIPAFTKWTRKSLSILVGLMKAKDCKKGDVMYREGDLADCVFFIVEGEFKFCKMFGVNQEVMMDLAGENLPIRNKSNRLSTPSRATSVAVLTKSQRQIFGHQEILDECRRKFTCVCSTRFAKVLELTKQVEIRQDFIRRTQSQDTWNVLQRMGAVEKDWLSSQLSKLSNAVLSKWRFALQKSRPQTPCSRPPTTPLTHKKTVSMTFESRLESTTLTLDGEMTHKSMIMEKTLRPGSGSPGKRRAASRRTDRTGNRVEGGEGGRKWGRSGSVGRTLEGF